MFFPTWSPIHYFKYFSILVSNFDHVITNLEQTLNTFQIFHYFSFKSNQKLFLNILRYEKQLEQEEAAYQQQRRRLYSEIQDEKERMADAAKRQRQESDRLQLQMEENNRKTVSAMKEEYEQARDEQERRHRVGYNEITGCPTKTTTVFEKISVIQIDLISIPALL